MVTILEKHSQSVETSVKAAYYPHIIPCIIAVAELSWKFHQNPLIKRISTDNCWKTVFPQQMFDYNSRSRVAWSRDPACAVPITCQRTSRDSVTPLRSGSRSLPQYGIVRKFNATFYIFLYCVWRVSWITPKIQSIFPCIISDLSWKFRQNPLRTFWVMLLTVKQTNKVKTLPLWRK